MNYNHSFHAGGFADVLKHYVLVLLIKSLLRKDNGFCYIDTHAGLGFYDLFSPSAKKNEEFKLGIGKLLGKNPPDSLKEYLNVVQRINSRLSQSQVASIHYYPGSPMIVRHFLRPQDRMILAELHPTVFQKLKTLFAKDINVSTHLMDGYLGLKAFLPPKERRGLIFIDPPYERPNELATLPSILPIALKRFATGIYAIWYPIKDRATIDRFHRNLKENIQNPMMAVELSIYPEDSPLHLNGSGMIIINPPFQLQKQLEESIPWAWKMLSIEKQGQFRVQMLTSEKIR
ncbi:MAG TPA: 23S rRNA (adenine(2030)-N(6))-methyltransferase RlmJ [Gammaproteobacteria bacterium]|jgi:23S rRNA (adenine2030-N6)-methyltransferase|nr:23S rRNA (adenine(2030)-N(6))-methyltransferase RlmJ [Gammaproteobacteria bacterium]